MVFGLKLSLPKKAPAPVAGDVGAPLGAVAPAGVRQASAGPGGPGGAPKTTGLTVNEFVARTKRCREKGLEPTKPELVAYARYLGIDTIADGDLMWIAEEALSAPLPAEWTEHHDGSDRVFYYNVQTRGSSWTHPLEQLHRDTYKKVSSFRSGGLSKDEQAAELDNVRKQTEDSEREAHQELQAWQEHTDPQGQKFYHNREKQQSVWTDPRPAQCHMLYLQMKMLRVLSKHTGHGIPAGAAGRPVSPRRDGGDWLPKDKLRKVESLAPPAALSPDRGDGRAASPTASDGEGESPGKQRRRRKRKEEGAKQRSVSEGAPLLGAHSSPKGGDGLMPPPMMQLKRPTTSAVEEVRKALGVAHSLPPMGGGLGSRGHPAALMSLPGLDEGPAARPRVRAGIRLQPLTVGA